MRENSENMQETAIREAEEEVGLKPEDFVFLGSLPSFLTRSGILLHPSVALLRRPFLPQLNVREVQRTFWISLERFLDDSSHTSFDIDHNYTVHSFMFEEAHTYGLTALLCIVTATAVLERTPSFDIAPALPLRRIAAVSPSDLIDEIFSCIGRPADSRAKL